MDLKCPNCGGTEFKDGTLKGKFDIKLVENDSGLIAKNTILGGKNVNVKICQGCRYLMLFG